MKRIYIYIRDVYISILKGTFLTLKNKERNAVINEQQYLAAPHALHDFVSEPEFEVISEP